MFLTGLLVLLPVLSFAQQWKIIAETDESITLIDTTSVAKIGSKRKAWFTVDYLEKRKSIDKTYEYQSYVQLQFFDCVEKTMAESQANFYSGPARSGSNVHGYTMRREKMQYDDPVPGTVGAAMLRMVCGWKL